MNGGDWTLEAVGLLPAYSFVDHIAAASARVEVMGIPTIRGEFRRPESTWMMEGDQDLDAKQTLLRVDAELIPAVGEGQRAAKYPVVKISVRDYEAGVAELETPVTAQQWAAILTSELAAKKAIKDAKPSEHEKALDLARDLLGSRAPVSIYTLKQFRDVVDPNKACYQTLLRVSRTLEDVFDVREIEHTIRVRIYDFPTLRIVDSLGIVAKQIREQGSAGIVYGTQAIRPFYIRATIDESLGERVLSQARDLPAQFGDDAFHSMVRSFEPIPGQREGAAKRALVSIDPQTVIEALLSREWGNVDENARRRRGRGALVEMRELMLAAERNPNAADVEAAIYARVPLHNDTALKTTVLAMIHTMKAYTVARLEMEDHFSVLATWRFATSPTADAGEDDSWVSEPGPETLAEEVGRLLDAIKAVVDLGEAGVKGEPWPHGDLNARGDFLRLRGLLDGALKPVMAARATRGQGQQVVELVNHAYKPLLEAVLLARRFCNVHREALLDQLSRSYQKPDFCVRRDAVGPERDRLLPMTLSWDEDWYSGDAISRKAPEDWEAQ